MFKYANITPKTCKTDCRMENRVLSNRMAIPGSMIFCPTQHLCKVDIPNWEKPNKGTVYRMDLPGLAVPKTCSKLASCKMHTPRFILQQKLKKHFQPAFWFLLRSQVPPFYRVYFNRDAFVFLLLWPHCLPEVSRLCYQMIEANQKTCTGLNNNLYQCRKKHIYSYKIVFSYSWRHLLTKCHCTPWWGFI